MDNLNGDMVKWWMCHELIAVIDDGETLSLDKWNAECAEVVADVVWRYLYLKLFEFLNLYTMAREIISLDNAKLKLYVGKLYTLSFGGN